MSQCVPSWDLDDGPSRRLQLHHPSSTTTRSPLSDYEVAELTWKNGQLSMHGHRGGAARAGKQLASKVDHSASVPSWAKTGHASGTLEAVVDQATRAVVPSLPAAAAAQVPNSAGGPLVPCLGGKSPYHTLRAPVPAAMDALVPCSNLRPQNGGDDSQPCRLVPDAAAGTADGGGGGTCVASCSGRKRRTRLRAGDGNCSVTGSAPSRGLTFDTCDINGAGEDTGFTSASPTDGSPETENTSFGRPLALTEEDHDSVSHSRQTQRDGRYEEEKIKGDVVGRSSVSTKRSRAAAVHNQSERKRRDRINQKMKTLQKLVPNSSKTDKASILDEAIEYLKQLQAQVQMVNRMSSVPHMMMPMTMQHMQMAMMAQQMAQMAQMGMGMGMMDMNGLCRAEQPGLGPVPSNPPPPFFPLSSSRASDAPTGDRPQAPAGAAVLPQDPFASSFMACQNPQQPTTSMDAYGRMTELYRQLYQQPPAGTNSKTKPPCTKHV